VDGGAGVAAQPGCVRRPEGQHRQAVGIRLHRCQGRLQFGQVSHLQRFRHPLEDTAPFGQSAARQRAPAIHPVAPQPIGDVGYGTAYDDSHGARRPHGQRDPRRRHTPAADVGCCAIAHCGKPRHVAQGRPARGELTTRTLAGGRSRRSAATVVLPRSGVRPAAAHPTPAGVGPAVRSTTPPSN